MRSLAFCLVASLASAQELVPDAHELTHVRKVVGDWPAAHGAVVVAMVPGHAPVVLGAGTSQDGAPVGPHTLVPLGSLARLLIADAAHVALDGDVDRKSGVRAGPKGFPVRELLVGAYAIPDYADWRPGSPTLAATDILRCATITSELGFWPWTSNNGMGELLLLEGTLLGTRSPDWPTFVRSALSPRAAGIDARDAAKLEADEVQAAVGVEIARHARPAALRLMLSGKDLANWWTWRMTHDMPRWDGPRVGHEHQLVERDLGPRWTFATCSMTPVKTTATTYSDLRAAILFASVGSEAWDTDLERRLVTAFEADLVGPLPEGTEVRFGGGIAGGRVGAQRHPLRDWIDKTWKTVADAATPCELQVEKAADSGMWVTLGRTTFRSSQVTPQGDALRIVLTAPDERGGILWLAETPKGAGRKTMTAALYEWGPLHRVPHVLELHLAAQ